jgi:hypothetical protein
MLILIPDGGSACGHCGKVYNPYLGDRFWSAREYPCHNPDGCETGGGVHDMLCDDCHREYSPSRG